MRRINLIGADSGAGLTRDFELLRRALVAAGHDVTITPIVSSKGRPSDRLRGCRRLLARSLREGPAALRYDANIMLEKIYPRMMGLARANLLIPNPEWFPDRVADRLVDFDLVLAKTHHAEAIFRDLGPPVSYIGFSSEDRRVAGVPRRAGFLHTPGKSPMKGTLPLVSLWAAHPHWPTLTVVYRAPEVAELPPAPNVVLLRDRLSEEALLELQNAHAFHLCPSETEGYGHYLGEAMSVGAVTVTLDAPPMNELVGPDRGILVPAQATGTRSLAALYGCRPTDLAAAIERCIAMPAAERDALGLRARAWFEQNRAAFPPRLVAVLDAFDRRRRGS